MTKLTKSNRRQFISATAATCATLVLPRRTARAESPNEKINLGFISCGGRAGNLMSNFESAGGVNIVGLCDTDEQRLGLAQQRFPRAQAWRDLRDLIDSESIDAVVVATCNHWHCLAAIWAMQAGKDVYVEKPLSHSQWEGAQTVAAARKYDRICQVGTQQRSDPMQTEIKKFLHEDQALGKIISARVNRFGIRDSIGKRTTPLDIDKNVAYDLWLGPAEDRPILRNQLHYDWHWDWNTGSGEMGNWGVHMLDDLRNTIFQDQVALPQRICGGGGRVVWNDAGETPNVHFAYFDTGSIPVVIGLTNLPAAPGAEQPPTHPGPDSGYVASCEGGSFHGERGRGVAKDRDGKVIREFIGNSGDVVHQKNFLDAVRARDRSLLNAEVAVGNASTGWCNLANIAFRSGKQLERDHMPTVELDSWKELIGEMEQHLASYDLKLNGEGMRVSPLLRLDPQTERYTGEHAEQANQWLKRKYRKGFEVPNLVDTLVKSASAVPVR